MPRMVSCTPLKTCAITAAESPSALGEGSTQAASRKSARRRPEQSE